MCRQLLAARLRAAVPPELKRWSERLTEPVRPRHSECPVREQPKARIAAFLLLLLAGLRE
jgi:hypothetical protein